MDTDQLTKYLTEHECPYCHIKDSRIKCRDMGRDIVICNICGLYYPSPRMNSTGQKLYWEKYDSQFNSEKGSGKFQEFINKPVSRGYSHIVKYITKNLDSIPDDNTLALDIGTFDGAFVYAVNQYGYKGYGLDPVESAVHYARLNGLDVYKGFFPEDIPDEIKKKKFKVITFLENIYYYTKLDKVFTTAYDLLDKKGFLFIKTLQGNSPHFWNHSRIKRYNISASSMPTISSLKNILVKSGFEVVKTDCFPFYNFLSMLTMVNNKYLNKAFRIFNPIFNYLHWSDRIIVLARKAKD